MLGRDLVGVGLFDQSGGAEQVAVLVGHGQRIAASKVGVEAVPAFCNRGRGIVSSIDMALRRQQQVFDSVAMLLPAYVRGIVGAGDPGAIKVQRLVDIVRPQGFRQRLGQFPPQPGEEWREVGLDQLVRFFRNPCRFLLKYRMGIAFADEHEELLQDEPFFPDRRQKRELADRLLPLYLAGRAKGDIHACALAGIEFPCGSIGSLLLDQEMKSIGAFARNLAPDVAAPILPPHSLSVEFDLDGQKWRLGGSFSDLRPAGRVRHRYDNANAGDYLSGWIEHLFLNTAAAPAKAATQTIWHSRNGHYRYPELPCGDAIEHLRRLLEMYRSGLTRPLHFFPRTAWAYMANEESMGKAATAWKSKLHENWGEGSDPSYRLALRGIKNPLDASFIECSKTVFDPLLRHIEDGRLS